jgi:hypothetical protein
MFWGVGGWGFGGLVTFLSLGWLSEPHHSSPPPPPPPESLHTCGLCAKDDASLECEGNALKLIGSDLQGFRSAADLHQL